MENKLLAQMIQKLGLSDHENLAPKSTELLRLLQVKSSGGVANLGDYARATICIDLASGLLGLPFDLETGLKMSGLKKTVYTNSKRTVEKILDISKVFGINEICVQLGLSQVKNEALVLLESYKRFVDGGNVALDLTHPQYATMAVFQACKRLKVKPPKTKLVPFSHLKPAQWALLEKNWEKFMASSALPDSSKTKKQPAVEQTFIEPKEEVIVQAQKHSSVEAIEPYVSWKKRMLEKAYRELKAMETAR
ncbi:origin recognition complex subunit 6 [Uranotaenia lowii]|uniref:origin recognition complex subunit 6 n=1 Tax=Uranotaenia lowii TaxID=190385 RepID=UPI0024789CA1|nr:origin recognition complex subunit 6 [Uranotaenia lowii]